MTLEVLADRFGVEADDIKAFYLHGAVSAITSDIQSSLVFAHTGEVHAALLGAALRTDNARKLYLERFDITYSKRVSADDSGPTGAAAGAFAICPGGILCFA